MAILWPKLKHRIPAKSYILCLLAVTFFMCLNALGQNQTIDLTATGIQIGQQVPDITVSNIHNYKTSTAKLSDFRGKLLIIDFWATWCSPCVAMIPKMDSLQKVFGDKVQFVSVTYQKEEEVLPFLEKFEKQQGKHFELPVVTGDTSLHRLFPHRILPHYAWINKKGLLQGITELFEITTLNVQNSLTDPTYKLIQKRDFYRADVDLKNIVLLNPVVSSPRNEHYFNITELL
ncbi:Thiol-disulfide isomerase or thioredoxin [bacterium A37T11]|nr:Thiol-disulfide isomerase or thioredoxin [bacterium A37T11]